MDGTGSGLYPMSGLGIVNVEPSCYATTLLIMLDGKCNIVPVSKHLPGSVYGRMKATAFLTSKLRVDVDEWLASRISHSTSG
jgi:hypothetical protein